MALLMTLSTTACNDDPGGNNGQNPAEDVGMDATQDAGTDTTDDADDDTGTTDGGSDATDGGPDDTGTDATDTDDGGDAISDAGDDTGTNDTGIDTGPDVVEPPIDDLDPTGGDWSQNFAAPGAVGEAGARVYAVEKSGTNQYYVGGSFAGVGSITAPEVAYYDGTNWLPTGSGPGITVYTLELLEGGNVLAGGEGGGGFGIGGSNSIEQWDGNQWSTFAGVDQPSGSPNSSVNEIHQMPNGDIVVAGSFGGLDGSATPNLAMWDGTKWATPGGVEFDGEVEAVEMVGSDLCAAGNFENVGTTAASRVACWDGSQWNALGAGLPSRVLDLLEFGNGEIIAAGEFALGSPGSFVIGIARWDGTKWSGFAGGVGGGQVTRVRTLEPGDGDDEFYAGGHFSGSASVSSVNVVKWDGTQWISMDGGAVNEVGISGAGATGVYDMVVDGSKILTGGWFSRTGSLFTLNIARWDDSTDPGTWERLLDPSLEYLGVPGVVNALTADGFGTVYAGGDFNFAGETNAQNIAKLEGNSWTKLGDGLNGNVSSMALDSQGNLYAAGSFTQAGSTPVAYIAKWDGSSWSNVGPGLNGTARSIVVDANDNVYVGGTFTQAGGVSVSNVAMWDGSTWSGIGSGLNDIVTSLAIDPNGTLYAGGFFDATGNGAPANRIAKFENGAWLEIGGGIGDNSYVGELDIYQGNLLVAGKFEKAGGEVVNSITMWDGTKWTSFDNGLYSFGTSEATISSIAPKANGFFIGGTFSQKDGTTLNRVAWWDGTGWQPLGEGLADLPEALVVDSNRLIAGGGFTKAGTFNSYGIGIWDYTPDTTP